MTTDTSRMPYQLPFPPEVADEVLVSPAVPEDERVWVPQAEGLHFRPLLLHTRQGYWCNLLRVRRDGDREPPPPSDAGHRLRHQGPLALPRARLGRRAGRASSSSPRARPTRSSCPRARRR